MHFVKMHRYSSLLTKRAQVNNNPRPVAELTFSEKIATRSSIRAKDLDLKSGRRGMKQTETLHPYASKNNNSSRLLRISKLGGHPWISGVLVATVSIHRW